MNEKQRLLLLSTSTVFGSGYLEYADAEIREFLGNVSRVLFVPFALHDHAAYAGRVRDRFATMGYAVDSLHEASDAQQTIEGAEAVFIGGGNTFRLLKALYDFDLLDTIRSRVSDGMPYVGSSAGSNVAGPTIRTTNDMPIVQPPSFDALSLVPFQINPHYLDSSADSTHMGETGEERLRQYLEENATPVIALREGAFLRSADGALRLGGSAGGLVFRRGEEPLELEPGTRIGSL